MAKRGQLSAACRAELGEFDGPLEAFLRSRHDAWHVVGRVHFHLAENRGDPEAPFAFLATYSPRLSRQGKAQHRPLGEAIRDTATSSTKPGRLRSRPTSCSGWGRRSLRGQRSRGWRATSAPSFR